MTQNWPLFLKKTGLKESDFQTVAGDGQTKLNAVINGQAESLTRLRDGQSMKIKDATGRRLSDQVRRPTASNMVSSGIVAKHRYVKANADLVAASWRRRPRRSSRREGAQGRRTIDPRRHPKGGKIDTLTQDFS